MFDRITQCLHQIIFTKKCLGFFFVFLFFSTVNSRLFEENEFPALEDSLKHHLKYQTKTIVTVPDDCSDHPQLKLDLVFQLTTANGVEMYAVWGNSQYYVRIDNITFDHLPVIHRYSTPRRVDGEFKRKLFGKLPITEYKFVGPVYLHHEGNGKYRLIGFNQVWVGCPQPMCISAGIDSVLESDHPHYIGYHRSMVILFRGNYYWYLSIPKEEDIEERMNLQPPMVDNVLKIADRYYDQRSHYYYSHYDYNSKPQLNDSMVIPHYMDAAISGVHKYNACVYFFKDENFVCYEWFSYLSESKKIADNWDVHEKTTMKRVNAAFHVKQLLYFLSGDQLYCFSGDRSICHDYPKHVTDIHPRFPTDANAAFQANGYIYIIKGALYYRFPTLTFPSKILDEDLEPRYIYQDLFGCDDGHYAAWGFKSYDNFLETIAQHMLPPDTDPAGLESGYRSGGHAWVTVLSILIVLFICALVFGMVFHYKPIWIQKTTQIFVSPFRRF